MLLRENLDRCVCGLK
jgi:nitronate monooxygenase